MTTSFELGTDGPSLILVGVDGSTTSMRAGSYAAGLARRQGARLACIFIEKDIPASGFAPGAAAANSVVNSEIAAALEQQVVTRSVELGIEATFYSRGGDPFSEISKLADELKADAVVVGASESAGHKLIGSLATRLVRAGRWPVTVVP